MKHHIEIDQMSSGIMSEFVAHLNANGHVARYSDNGEHTVDGVSTPDYEAQRIIDELWFAFMANRRVERRRMRGLL